MPEKKEETRGDLGAGEVTKKLNEEQEKGYRGTVPDPTPNHAYTVAGVTSGEPTPETDEAQRAKAAEGKR